jgi:hypothetical protein
VKVYRESVEKFLRRVTQLSSMCVRLNEGAVVNGVSVTIPAPAQLEDFTDKIRESLDAVRVRAGPCITFRSITHVQMLEVGPRTRCQDCCSSHLLGRPP